MWTEQGETEAPARAKLVRDPLTKPTTGDWVGLELNPPVIQELLPRRTQVSRKAPGEETVEQVLGANVDRLFLVVGLDRDFNLRRLERYLSVGWASGAQPYIVLNKADLHEDRSELVAAVRRVAGKAPVVETSAATGEGVDALRALLEPGLTVALMGSSGVGKSALTNRLLGVDLREVGEVRETDGRGRHTTVGRELLLAPAGWLLMDLPGLREIQPWEEEGVERAFEDVERFAAECRFRDCQHEVEPGCAVRAAVEAGELDEARVANYRNVLNELERLEQRQSSRASAEPRRQPRRVHRVFRKTPKR